MIRLRPLKGFVGIFQWNGTRPIPNTTFIKTDHHSQTKNTQPIDYHKLTKLAQPWQPLVKRMDFRNTL
jgi:hypothetical protein